ncbi:MAG: hypothetical protein ACFFB3_19765 [Candidatus Hodarchaeota archaeon]
MGKMMMVTGIIILVLGGLVTVFIGLVAPMFIDQAVEDGLKDALVYEEEDLDEPWLFDANLNAITEGDEWLYNGPENVDAAPTYDSFYIWNITNYNPLTNSFSGGKPEYDEVGPLVCRKIDNKTIDGISDGIINFREASWYLLNETGSTIDLNDIVYTWNPLYRSYCEMGLFNIELEALLQMAGTVLPKSETELYFSLGAQIVNGTFWLTYIDPDLIGVSGANPATDPAGAYVAALQQWGNLSYVGAPTGVGTGEPALIAMMVDPTKPLNMTFLEANRTLFGENIGLTNVTALGTFFSTVAQGGALGVQALAASYSLTTTQIEALFNFVNYVLTSPSAPSVFDTMWSGGFSLVAKRTVNQVLFSYNDPVLEANTAIFDNSTAWDGGKLINSGSKDLDKIWEEYSDDGLERWTIGWEEDVAGTDATHWAPDVGKEDTLLVWNSDTRRQLDFVYLKDSEVEGIKTLRFHLDPDELAPSSKYHQYIHGFGNMTPTMFDDSTGLLIKLGTPIYIGHPRFQIWSVTQDTVPEELDIIVDVEPNTGLVLWGHKRLQVNVKLYNFSFFNGDVKGAYALDAEDGTSHYIEPVVWIDRFAMIPADKVEDAKDDINALESGKELSGMASIAGLGAGLVLFAAGAALVIIPKFAS